MMKTINAKNILNGLVQSKHITNQTAAKALQSNIKKKTSIVSFLLDSDSISSAKLARSIAEQCSLPLIDITKVSLLEHHQDFLDNKTLHQYHLLPISLNDNILKVAISDPTTIHAMNEIAKENELVIKLVIAEHHQLQKILNKMFPLESMNSESVNKTKKESLNSTTMNSDSYLFDSELDKIDLQLDKITAKDTSDFPVIRFINKIILDSISKDASDIHFEPYENKYRIRIRIDGILYQLAQPDVALAPRLAARLKVMAGLDISERRIPQDGRFKINLGKDKTLGFRVNTCPTLFGEKIVLRILDPKTVQVGVDKLGFEDHQKQTFLEAIHKNQGMILVTGPTGSGKTVTLYTALNLLNNSEQNISTVEDPVEIYLPGINQVNINTKTSLDFASVLRAFLRQDPDIIMIGEIRDKETSDIGIKAAQTGHLVLSTLHTNSAADTLTRMDNMGIAPFNIATSVNLVIAQRLVRRLCENCKKSVSFNEAVLLSQGFNVNEVSTLKLYKARGCKQCTSGYKGRVGIFEVLQMTPAICDVIMNNGTSIDIYNKAITEDFVNLRQAGLNKVKRGETSLEEVNRVTG